jgi:hypothetical protein
MIAGMGIAWCILLLLYKDKNGLPYIDLDKLSETTVTIIMQMAVEGVRFAMPSSRELTEGFAHIKMVQGNIERLTKCKVLQAKNARQAQVMIRNPSKKDFKGMVSNHLVLNCPVTYVEITNARNIFGPDLAGIHGKTVQGTPEPVVADMWPFLVQLLSKTECNI